MYKLFQTLANYSDCESENLIPNDRNKKKDRNQVIIVYSICILFFLINFTVFFRLLIKNLALQLQAKMAVVLLFR